MISLFEIIIETLSIPLEKWDKLRVRYKIILFTITLVCIAGIIILFNQSWIHFIVMIQKEVNSLKTHRYIL